MKIIVGLGNPSEEYQETRHNIGYKVIGNLKKKFEVKKIFKRKFFRGWEIKINGEKTVLVKPKTFMNESGIPVQKSLESFGEKVENLVVLHDDIDIPLGEIKITMKKGPGGHKGVLSIINEVGSKDFVRVRIGIGKDTIEESRTDYVLSEFFSEEQKLVEESLKKASFACIDIVKLGIEKAMTRYNT